MPRAMIKGLAATLAALLLSAPALADCSIQRFAELPVTMVGLRPTLTAAINGSEQTFLADSGAFFSVISPGTARDLGLKLTAPPGNLRMIGVGGDAAVRIATVKAFGIVGATIPNVQFVVGGSELGTAGVIGQNLLGIADVEYDLPHGAIRLFRTKACQKTNLAYWARPGEAFSMMDIADRATARFQTSGSVMVNDKSVHAVFDTGAGTILSLGAAARAGLRPDMPGAMPGGAAYGFGRKAVPTWIVPVKKMTIGDEQIERARIRIGDIGDSADMLIGADFFISHRVLVSNAIHKLFFTYTGGPIFDITARRAGDAAAPTGAVAAAGPPLDAAALSRRAAVEAAQHDRARALADLMQAVTLAPSEPRYLLQRAELRLEDQDAALAAADIDAAIRLKPEDVEARMLRAELDLIADKRENAIADLDAASAASGTAADQRLAIAYMYQRAGALEKSIDQSTLWIANHPVDAKRPQALNARCWARAVSSKELAHALDDCNAALRLTPRMADILDSRGMVHLRMGDREKAIADYDAALALDPKIGWSLYGRSLAEQALGQAPAAKADMAAALAINPELPALARKYGIGQ